MFEWVNFSLVFVEVFYPIVLVFHVANATNKAQFALFALTNLETKERMTQSKKEDKSWIANFQNTGAKLRPIKIVVIGPVCTGRTSFIERFINGTFDELVCATIGASSLCKSVEVDGISLKLEIWGLPTQKHHHLNK